ncbi:MAG: UxaA family hydrolase [Desulfitobacterium sp.]
MKKQAVVIHKLDNVATCVEHFTAGTTISFFLGGSEEQVVLRQDIPLGHKVAIRTIAKNEDVLKYAESIGVATIDIQPGQHVHVHNLESKRGRGDLEQGKEE